MSEDDKSTCTLILPLNRFYWPQMPYEPSGQVKAQFGRASPKTVSSELASPATSSCFVHFYLGLQISFTLHGISICTKYISEAEVGRSPPQLALKLADYKDFNQRMPL